MMYERGTFHESYYTHPCIVSKEKDVLLTEIHGRGWWASLRRWWYDWFLLSYNDLRCRIYYTSSHALRIARARHFRRYRSRIHPLSKFRQAFIFTSFIQHMKMERTMLRVSLWDQIRNDVIFPIFSERWTMLILGVLIANRILFHCNTATLYGSQPAAALITGVVFEMIILFDILINFKTGYTDENERVVILDASQGHMNYCTKKLFLHVAAALPLQSILMLRYGLTDCTFCKTNKFVCCLRILTIFNVIRIYEASSFWSIEKATFLRTYILKVTRIVTLGFLTLMYIRAIMEIFHIFVAIDHGLLFENSTFSNSVLMKSVESPKHTSLFFVAFEFSLTLKLLFQLGSAVLKYKHSRIDRFFSVLIELTTGLFILWSIVVAISVAERVLARDFVVTHKDRSLNWMRHLQLSDDLSEKVKRFYRHSTNNSKITEVCNVFYSSLPKEIKREMKLSSYFRHVKRVKYFSDWPVIIVEDLVMMLSEEVYLKGDTLVDTFSQGEGLIILYTGMLAVYDVQQREVGHLIDGDYFGELSLITDNEMRTSTVNALSFCKILILPKKMFRNYMRKYPHLFKEMRRALKEKYTKTDYQYQFDNKSENRPTETNL